MKKIALIIGISGQDGTYLADYLIKKKIHRLRSFQKQKKNSKL